eukprot:2165088-Pleurochrysis_carterae.AAC.2
MCGVSALPLFALALPRPLFRLSFSMPLAPAMIVHSQLLVYQLTIVAELKHGLQRALADPLAQGADMCASGALTPLVNALAHASECTRLTCFKTLTGACAAHLRKSWPTSFCTCRKGTAVFMWNGRTPLTCDELGAS